MRSRQVRRQQSLSQIYLLTSLCQPHDSVTESHEGSTISELNLVALSGTVGEPVAYKEQKGGAFIHNIVPQAGQENAMSNEGSKLFLKFHTENNYQPAPVRCSHILLTCKRQDSEAKAATILLVIDRIILDPRLASHVETLHQNVFESVNYGFQSQEPVGSPIGPHSILQGEPGVLPGVFCDFQMVRGCTEKAAEALAVFKEVCSDPVNWHCVLLKPGEVLIIDNRRCMHGRQPFAATFRHDDRWLQRIHVMQDLWASRAHAALDNPRLLHGIN